MEEGAQNMSEYLQDELSESTVRSRAVRAGYRVHKSRRMRSIDNDGEYMLVDSRNWVVLGQRYDASLADIDTFLDNERSKRL
jgi:hypothetical protein